MALMSKDSAALISPKLVVMMLWSWIDLLLVRRPFAFRHSVQHFFITAIARSFFIHSPCFAAIVKMALVGVASGTEVAAI